MSYMVVLQWVILRKLDYPVQKLLVGAAFGGFSDIRSAAEEKWTGDDKKVIEIEDSIHCILNRLCHPDVEIDHFSNSILHTVVYGQIDSYDAKRIELLTLNKDVENLLSDKELFEAEIEGSLEYEENINEVRYKIKSKINKIHVSQPVYNCNGANESNERTNIYSSEFSLNLPELRIPTFSGDSSTYLEFINSVTNAIDANESLSNADNFIFLKSFLSGEASKIVSAFALTEDNYKSCLNFLKDGYDRQGHLNSCSMNKLLEIEPVKSSFNLEGFKKLHDESETNIRNLDSLGIVSGNYGHLLTL
ncbi:integrase catalytic domain-containing protein [Trichonephila clavipes]|nr:integrase catalytic domain-containing protein [Trichonephila clavipes]